MPVYKRKDSPYWWGTYTDCDKRRRRESLGTPIKKLAEMALARKVHMHYLARYDFISRDQLRAQERGMTALDTFIGKGRYVEHFIDWARLHTANDFAGDHVVAKLYQWRGTMPGLSARTINRKVWDVQAFGKRLWREGYISTNAAERVENLKETGERVKPHRAFTPQEAERLVNECPERYRLFYTLRLWTGLRGSEARRIRRSDLVLDESPVLVVRPDIAKNRLGGTLPLPSVLATALAPLRFTAPTVEIFRDLPTSDNRRDKHLRIHLDALGFDPELNGRSFRMSFVSWLEAAGVELGVRMKLRRDKGSDSIRLTNVVYSDPKMIAHILRDGMAKLEAWHMSQIAAAGTCNQRGAC